MRDVFFKASFRIFLLLLLATIFAPAHAAAALTVTPSSVSNTYAGTITLQVTGLTNGESVVIQKFLDANGNGVIDAGDTLWQQFNLTDGQANVFHDGATAVTNFNVPGDTDSATGQITARLNLPVSGFEQTIVGKYLFKLSSPYGNFLPQTNSFTVTNFPYAQSFSGSVVANTTNVPDAVILLFQPSPTGNLNPQGGTVADNSGHYSVSTPPGTYLVVAFKINFVANVGASPALTLGSGTSISTNVNLISTDRTISGSIVDASNAAVRLPGMLLPVSSKNGLLTVAFADTNGNFTVGVTSDKWKIEGGDGPIAFHSYLRPQTKTQVDATAGSVSGVNIALPKATALFYGTVKVAAVQPLNAINVFSSDHTNTYEQNVISDLGGNYFAGALSGAPWAVGLGNDTPTNYVFSEPTFSFSGTNLSSGQALRYDFNALPATQRITGHVQLSDGRPVPLVQVFANAIIGSEFYATQIDTNTNGDYTLNVANNGNWSVSVSCQGGDDSLDVILGSGNYQCPNTQIVTITNNNGVANFTVTLASQPVLSQPTRPAPGQVGFYLSGALGSNYTILISTNIVLPMSNWTPAFATNLTVSPAFLVDTHATNKQLFYRALLGP